MLGRVKYEPKINITHSNTEHGQINIPPHSPPSRAHSCAALAKPVLGNETFRRLFLQISVFAHSFCTNGTARERWLNEERRREVANESPRRERGKEKGRQGRKKQRALAWKEQKTQERKEAEAALGLRHFRRWLSLKSLRLGGPPLAPGGFMNTRVLPGQKRRCADVRDHRQRALSLSFFLWVPFHPSSLPFLLLSLLSSPLLSFILLFDLHHTIPHSAQSKDVNSRQAIREL